MVSPSQLEHWDRCRRMWQYLDRYRMARITPLGSVYSAIHLCLQATPESYREIGPKLARDWIMQEAGKRGVYTTRTDPYDVMHHYAHLAEVLVRTLRQPNMQSLRQAGRDIALDYKPESWLVDGGVRLMRVVLVDRWTDYRQLSELHSWRTVGDVCVTGLPMTIRVLVIGDSQNGKRYGHWTRGWMHPYTKTLRFKRRTGKDDFAGDWRQVWRHESGVTVDKWIEAMASDGVLRECAFPVNVRVPDKVQRDRVLEDIWRIREEMEQANSKIVRDAGVRFPMTRSACDDPIHGTCPFSDTCYSPAEDMTPERTGLFVKREEWRD